MTKPKQAEAVEMVPIERITVINPRVRNSVRSTGLTNLF
jgi:hypothetical protein